MEEEDDELWESPTAAGGSRAGASAAGSGTSPAAAGSSGAGASAAGSASVREKKKKPKPKKRPSFGDGALPQKAKKRSKPSKAKVTTTWTDSEDEAIPVNGGAAAAQPGTSWAAWVKKPPPTMAFASNVAQEPPVYWAMKKGGSEAANLLDSMGRFAHPYVHATVFDATVFFNVASR